jgi:hypothetical protein
MCRCKNNYLYNANVDPWIPLVSPFSSIGYHWVLLLPRLEIIEQHIPKQNASDENYNDYRVGRLVYLAETKVPRVLKHANLLLKVTESPDIHSRSLCCRVLRLPPSCGPGSACRCHHLRQQRRSRIGLFIVIGILLLCLSICRRFAMCPVPKTLRLCWHCAS